MESNSAQVTCQRLKLKVEALQILPVCALRGLELDALECHTGL